MEYTEAPTWAVELREKLDLVLDKIVNDEEEEVGTAKAALILGVSQRTVQEWERQGKMPKKVSNYDEKHRYNKKAIQRMALGNSKGGRKRLIS